MIDRVALFNLLSIAMENQLSVTIDFHKKEIHVTENYPKVINAHDITWLKNRGFKFVTPVERPTYVKKGFNL